MKNAFYEFKVQKLRVCESDAFGKVETPMDILPLWEKGPKQATWFDPDKECLIVFGFDTKANCRGFYLISLGSLNESTARIADILKPVIVGSHYSFLIAHNHPSGDSSPSPADIEITRRIVESARIMNIRFFDHIIIGEKIMPGNRGYFSFRENEII